MCFFLRNGKTSNDSLCIFINQGTSFLRSGKVSDDLCYFHKAKNNTKRNQKLYKTFSTKIEITVIILFPQNGKYYNSKFYFQEVARYLMICRITLTKWKILETEA